MAELTGLRIALNRCPHGVEMLSLDFHHGGTRFAGPKCCGSWRVVGEWRVTAKALQDIAEEAVDWEEEERRG